MRAHTITTQARVRGRLRMRHGIVVVSAVVLGAAVMAADASAGFRSVHDPRGDAGCYRGREGYGEKRCLDSTMRSADIVRVTAGHEGGRLRHTIRVVGKFQSGWLLFSADSDKHCEWSLGLQRGKHKVEFPKLRECGHQGPADDNDGIAGPGGHARVEFHRHSVGVFFRESQIGNPDGYGWQAGTSALGPPDRGLAEDYVPDGFDGYIPHELG
jgi:hypothetical protein